MTYAFNNSKHIHSFEGKPLMGTTTLIKEMFPPPLAWWASGKALEKLGWKNPKTATLEERMASALVGHEIIKTLDLSAYESFLQECYKNHDEFKKEAGASGTDLHDLIETVVKEAIASGGFLKEEKYDNDGVERFATWGRGKKFIHSEVYVYSEFLWLGGIVDLIYEEDGKTYIADIKTSKGIYPSQFIQMGLYDLQQGENGFFTAEGKSVGGSQNIEGYTVVNLPRINEEVNVKTYRNTQALKSLGVALVESYKTKCQLEDICK